MKNKIWHVIGVMSGTSLDGIDLAYVKFSDDGAYNFELIEKDCINYSEKWKNNLKQAVSISAESLTQLNVDYAKLLADEINQFIAKKKIEKIDFIASHGHTIFHQPEKGFTLQIGCGATLAAQTNLEVVCDFRTQDVALGGQGAPLVPIGDQWLFGTYKYCLNLGGFSNVSFELNNQRVAFDICPVNIVLNHYTRSVGMEYDNGGALAAQGQVNEKLLDELNNINYYTQEIPKSLGFEYVQDTVLPIIDAYNLEVKDVLRTCLEHAAFQMAKVLNRYKSSESDQVLVTGGGAFNHFLIERLGKLSNVSIVLPENDVINYKEAIVFAFLGLLRKENKTNCLASVTGAIKDHSSGVIYSI